MKTAGRLFIRGVGKSSACGSGYRRWDWERLCSEWREEIEWEEGVARMRRPLRKTSDRSHDSNIRPQKWRCETDECEIMSKRPHSLYNNETDTWTGALWVKTSHNHGRFHMPPDDSLQITENESRSTIYVKSRLEKIRVNIQSTSCTKEVSEASLSISIS